MSRFAGRLCWSVTIFRSPHPSRHIPRHFGNRSPERYVQVALGLRFAARNPTLSLCSPAPAPEVLVRKVTSVAATLGLGLVLGVGLASCGPHDARNSSSPAPTSSTSPTATPTTEAVASTTTVRTFIAPSTTTPLTPPTTTVPPIQETK